MTNVLKKSVLVADIFTVSRSEQTIKTPYYIFNRLFHVCAACRLNFLNMGRKNKRQKCDSAATKGEYSNSGAGAQFGSKNQGSKKLQPLLKIPTKINLVVIGTGGPGTSQSLLVTTEYTRYLFNCGEGTQRLSAMSKSLRTSAFAKLSGLDHIFITNKSWENTGGLLGMAMTLEGHKNPSSKTYMNRDKTVQGQNSNGVPKITIHGPPGVENIAMMAKKFSVHANLTIVRHEGEYTDAGLTITPILIYKETSEALAHECELDYSSPAPKKLRRDSGSTEPSASQSAVAYAYICTAHPQLPKINIEKCLEAGVTIGPMVGCLQRGESVVLDDGRVVHPEQVTFTNETYDRPFLILECPSKDFISSMCQSSQLRPFLDKSEQSLAVVVHMTPADVFNSTEYQSWMRGFHDSTDHMVINREGGEVDLIRVREHQARLNIVNQDVFPMFPQIENTGNAIEFSGGKNAVSPQEGGTQPETCVLKKGQVVKACQGLHYVYRGKDSLGFQVEMDEFNGSDLQNYFMEIPEVQNEIAVLRKSVPATRTEHSETDQDEESLTNYPKLTFLGTGSSEPNLIRAQSCIVVQVSKHSVIILDCGEGSYGQLYRFFGKAKASKILRKVKAIFISHLHADHHLGLFSLLKERKVAIDDKNIPFTPAFVVAPVQMRRWLKFYQTELEPITHLFRFVKHQQKLPDFPDGMTLQTATFEDIQKELNLTEYQVVWVQHCSNAFGVTFTHANGFKLVYSGDTRPCESLVTAGVGCDLLIHEATHEDALEGHAKASKHSTFSEAINVGTKMGAKNIILTHFSQRYPYMAPLSNMVLPQNVGIAFDNMQVCPKTMRYLPHMIPALTSLFSVELQKYEARIFRRLQEDTESKTQRANNCS